MFCLYLPFFLLISILLTFSFKHFNCLLSISFFIICLNTSIFFFSLFSFYFHFHFHFFPPHLFSLYSFYFHTHFHLHSFFSLHSLLSTAFLFPLFCVSTSKCRPFPPKPERWDSVSFMLERIERSSKRAAIVCPYQFVTPISQWLIVPIENILLPKLKLDPGSYNGLKYHG